MFEEYIRMYSSRDDTLTEHFSENFSGFTGGGNFLVKNKEEWVAITRKDFDQIKDPIKIELKDLAVQSLADSIAVATGFFHIHLPIKDHILSKEMARLVLIFRQEPSGWKISHSSISIPYHLVREGEVYPMKELIERNQFLEEQIAERTFQLSKVNDSLKRTNEKLEKEIAEHMATEEALRISEDRFRQLAEIFPESIFEADLSGQVTYGNEHWYQQFGLTAESLSAGVSLFERVIPSDQAKVRRLTQDRTEGLHGGFLEYTALRQDGTTFDALAFTAPILRMGRKVGIRGFILDISERKRAEEEKATLQSQLQQSQKMESLGILVAGVAHNINNVLAIIMGTASLREQNSTEPTDLKAYQIIGKVCKRGRDVMNSLMQFARPTLSNQAPIEMNSILKEVCTLLESTTSKRIRIIEACSGHPLWFSGDAGTINHALVNLCVNSIDAMPNGGTLTLRTTKVHEDRVEISVEDDGDGIAPEILPHVMEPFFTTKEVGKGTGLGLSMTYGVIKAHGGTMVMSSEPGKGTLVKLQFPGIPAPAPGVDDDLPVPSLERLKVLLVDDEEDVRFLMQRMLEKAGVQQVQAVAGGQEALDALLSGAAPNLIILDQNMPGMDGARTLALIREFYPNLPVLIASGQPGIQEWDCFRKPKVAILSKPFSLDEIMAKLAQFDSSSV